MEYERTNVPSPSESTTLAYCHGTTVKGTDVSSTSSMVVEFNIVIFRTGADIASVLLISSDRGTKSFLDTPQTGHTQFSGISSKRVPGAIPLSGSPIF